MTDNKAYIVTGPTSGMGYRAALELAAHGTVILVGRRPDKLEEVRRTIARRGQQALSVVCDLSDPAGARRAAAQIVALGLPIAGLLNNAGIFPMRASTATSGWDNAYATNYLGPFALTEALLPYLPDGADVLFVASAVEDPQRRPAKAAGFRGGRFISVDASARGQWLAGGSSMPGADAYATSKQCVLAAALALARAHPRLRINAVEPGLTPATALGRDGGAAVVLFTKLLVPVLVPLLMPFMSFLSTPKRAGRLLARLLLNAAGQGGVYYDQDGVPMRGSVLVHDPAFQDRVVAETRALLAGTTGGQC